MNRNVSINWPSKCDFIPSKSLPSDLFIEGSLSKLPGKHAKFFSALVEVLEALNIFPQRRLYYNLVAVVMRSTLSDDGGC